MDEFVTIHGFENYLVSRDGRVKSLYKSFFDPNNCLLKPSLNHKGYLLAELRAPGKKCKKLIHRLVAQAFIGDITGKQINHLNFIKTDNRVENLEIVSNAENNAHKIKHERQARGEKSGQAKLKESDIALIRRTYETGKYTYQELGKQFSVNGTAIGKIVRRERWAHIVNQ